LYHEFGVQAEWAPPIPLGLWTPIEFERQFPYDKAMNYYSNSSRVFFGGPVTRTVKLLIIINVAAYVLRVLLQLMHSNFLDIHFGLIPALVTHNFWVWQLATYMFMHHDIWHIFFNMLALFMFGNDLERYWGTARFLNYYFITGVGAGLCSWIISIDSDTVTMGASGAIYGLLLAYGLLYPNRIVYLNFLFPVKVKWMVIIYGAIAFLSSISGSEPGVSNIAHLGGLLVGYVYIKGKDWFDKYQVFREQQRREQLKRQFEVYYGEVRRKIETDKKKGPTIH
jgi:membrane associated rhomboid family serine protease